jgi:WD40 domain-containing protein
VPANPPPIYAQAISRTMPKRIVEASWSPCLQTLEGHCSTVREVAFAADGWHVVSGSYDGNIKIWDMSRPELSIRLGFVTIKGTYQDLVLHEIPKPVVEHDIRAYLESELAITRNDYNASVPTDRQLPADWPGQATIRDFIETAIPLFIFATTICRFLADRRCGSPAEQLREVMKYQTKIQESQLAVTYLPVLNQLIRDLPEHKIAKILEEFRQIIGSIVILASPLSTYSLARILLVSKDTIDNRLDLLHSVLSIPSSPNAPVRLLHLSFRDFLVSLEKGKSLFWVDETETHNKMAANCLRLLDKHLRTDICGVKWPGAPRSTIRQQTIDKALPSEVQYACLYWLYHIEQARRQIRDGDELHEFLRSHFLHWLEALSFIGRASESIALMKTLQALLEVSNLFGNI